MASSTRSGRSSLPTTARSCASRSRTRSGSRQRCRTVCVDCVDCVFGLHLRSCVRLLCICVAAPTTTLLDTRTTTPLAPHTRLKQTQTHNTQHATHPVGNAGRRQHEAHAALWAQRDALFLRRRRGDRLRGARQRGALVGAAGEQHALLCSPTLPRRSPRGRVVWGRGVAVLETVANHTPPPSPSPPTHTPSFINTTRASRARPRGSTSSPTRLSWCT